MGDMGMIKYDEIVEMSVLATKEGKDMGRISKMAIDLKEGQVVGFLIENKNGSEMVLPIANVDTYW
jgi:sporulation protein YlmC with PRC-barrel domain